ncbi:MAG: HEAT repeat domain-containing protein [Anaerolineales bacterium]
MNNQGKTNKNIPIEDLIEDLGENTFHERHQARLQLVERGKESIPALLDGLGSSNRHVRWGAVQALRELQEPSTAPDLVEMLKDDDPGIRWTARDSLIQMGRDSLLPLLRKYIDDYGSVLIREGAQHIIQALNEDKVLEEIASPELEQLAEENLVDSASASQQLRKVRDALDWLEERFN